MAGLGTDYLLKQHPSYKVPVIAVATINLIITAVFSQYILNFKQQGPINPNYAEALALLKHRDPTHYYIAAFMNQSSLPQDMAIQNGQFLLEDVYGLQMKDSPAAHYTPYDFGESKIYRDITPKYLVIDRNVKLPKPLVFNTKRYFTYRDVTVFRVAHDTPFVSDSVGKILQTTIGVDSFTIKASSATDSGSITLLQSYYPDWHLFVDGKTQALLPSRFLKFRAQKGTHVYTLRFYSWHFYLGALISALSIVLWLVLMLIPVLKKCRNA